MNDPARLLQTSLLIFAVTAVIIIGLAIVRWCRREMYAESHRPEDILADLEAAHEEGEIDDAELRRIHEALRRSEGRQLTQHPLWDRDDPAGPSPVKSAPVPNSPQTHPKDPLTGDPG